MHKKENHPKVVFFMHSLFIRALAAARSCIYPISRFTKASVYAQLLIHRQVLDPYVPESNHRAVP
jgi:hypothetical protein